MSKFVHGKATTGRNKNIADFQLPIANWSNGVGRQLNRQLKIGNWQFPSLPHNHQHIGQAINDTKQGSAGGVKLIGCCKLFRVGSA